MNQRFCRSFPYYITSERVLFRPNPKATVLNQHGMPLLTLKEISIICIWIVFTCKQFSLAKKFFLQILNRYVCNGEWHFNMTFEWFYLLQQMQWSRVSNCILLNQAVNILCTSTNTATVTFCFWFTMWSFVTCHYRFI